jgi:hypothetical protein
MAEYNTGESLFTPIARPNREAIRSIPLGAEMILANLTEGGVEFSGSTWNAFDRDRWLEMLEDEETSFDSTTLFYVDPSRVLPEPSPLLSAEEIIRQSVGGWKPTGSSEGDIDSLIRSVIALAREGMVVNPF